MSYIDLFRLPVFLLYLDPGTGSLLFSIVLGAAAAAFFVLKGVLLRGRSRFLKAIGKVEDASDSEHTLVFYSEGRQYAGTFRPILTELVKRNVGCLYLSSDADDPLLDSGSSLIHTKHIGKGHAAWGYLNTLRADLCVTTTPGLDVLLLKRSKNVGHYTHIIHAPTDKAFNRPYSFDYFDSVFISGSHQEKTIRTLEALRKSAPKQLIMAGCVYYDELVEAYRQTPPTPEDNGGDDGGDDGALRVLVAPTWGRNGLLTRYGLRVVQPLVEAGLRVTLRPHPQSKTSEHELLTQLQSESRSYPNLRWDDASSPLKAMQEADILISDISGIVFDFCFLTEKPVITLDFKPDKRGFEASDLPYEPWELRVLDLVGRKVSETDFHRLPEIIAEEVNHPSRKTQIRALRDESAVNFGCAAPPTVNHLLEVLDQQAEKRAGRP